MNGFILKDGAFIKDYFAKNQLVIQHTPILQLTNHQDDEFEIVDPEAQEKYLNEVYGKTIPVTAICYLLLIISTTT
jgi:hypothetical protein